MSKDSKQQKFISIHELIINSLVSAECVGVGLGETSASMSFPSVIWLFINHKNFMPFSLSTEFNQIE